VDLIVDAMKLSTHYSALNLLRAAHRGHTDWLAYAHDVAFATTS
jgi:hypothetical protein